MEDDPLESSSAARGPSAVRRINLEGDRGLILAADAVGEPSHPPVLLLHGGGQTRHSWRSTLNSLGTSGWYAVSMDLRGHGDSEWADDGDYSLEAVARDVVAVAAALDQPVFIGASLGGTSALAALGMTAERPVGRALVLVDVAPHIEAAGSIRIRTFMNQHLATGFASLEEVADAVHAYNPHRPRPDDLSGLRKNVRLRPDGRWYWHWDPRVITSRPLDNEPRTAMEGNDMLVAAARSLTVPTLLVRGRESDLLSEQGAERFLALVPHAEFADVGGAGHMVAGDKNDVFNDVVVSFLGRL